MGFQQIPAGTVVPPANFIPNPSLPSGLTLRNTYTTSSSGLTFPVDWLYVVVVGGGGSGYVNASGQFGNGGGAGACVQGWLRASDLTAVTIGAGGAGVAAGSTGSNAGSPTIAGPIRAPGGGQGNQSTISVDQLPELGAGVGGHSTQNISSGNFSANIHLHGDARVAPLLYGLFRGGVGLGSSTKPVVATSGAGGSNQGPGGDGFQGPAGGAGQGVATATLAPSGGSTTWGTTTILGGAGGLGNGSGFAGGGGGGAGILAAGSAGGAATVSASGTGGAGGSGGGGGGGTGQAGASGAGGNGCVLVYY